MPKDVRNHHPEKPSSASTPVRALHRSKSDRAQSEERFKLLVESVTDYAIFLLDPEGYIQSWNPGAQRFKGYSSEEAIGKHFSIFYTVEDIERRHPQYELQVARDQGRFEEEGWRVRKDGSRFWANVVITRLQDTSGNLLGFAKVTRDLTQKKIAEEQLRQSEEKYRLLIASVKDYAIFMLDPDGRIATWNDGAQRLKGYLPEEITGEHFSKFYPEEDIRARKPDCELEEATLNGRFEDEGWRVRKDGTRFWANVVISSMRNDAGKLIGFTKVTRDITDRKRLEEELRRSNEELDQRVQERTNQLEQAIRARDEFLSIISHELRTPITSMKLQVQSASRQLNKNDPRSFHEKTVRFVTGTSRQLDRLSKLIDDMLDVSRISMDRLTDEMIPLDLNEVIRETVERIEDQCLASGCPVNFKSDGPVWIQGDCNRLEQVFSNLLINAAKYGSSKPISVILRSSPDQAFVEIQDQGIGIAPEDQNRIFGRFERAISANTVSGLGLGLFISQKIVEAHHGKILLQSALGKGSTFTVVLPIRN